MIRIQTQDRTNLRPSASTDNAPIKSYPTGTILTGSVWQIILSDVYKNGVRIQMAGDKWLKVDAPEAGHMAVIHMGKTAGLPTILQDDTPTVPPPPSGERKIVSAVITYSDGTTERLV